jgi:hypothetical protein
MKISVQEPQFRIGSFLFGVAVVTIVGFFYAIFVRNVPLGPAAIILLFVFVIEALSGLAIYSRKRNMA